MQPTRRQVLALGALLPTGLATACTHHHPLLPDPAQPFLDAAVARENAILAGYDAAIARGSTPQLVAFRADHAAHLAALVAAVRPSSSPAPSAPPVPAPPGSLVALERSTAAAHADAAIAAPARIAPLLASLAACESSHAGLM